ncbi:MAG: tRNA (adenosine(37)-N6)-threonylcarbamoyltransferase complex ATPase subunit type 1 TsaE [Clostridia bacterium]
MKGIYIMDLKYTSKSTNETREIAKKLCAKLNKGDIVVLSGELGSGKTAFMYGVAEFFGLQDDISSPTFTIVNEYDTKDLKKIYHLDVYRLEGCDEFYEIGGNEYLENGICFIEWGRIIQDALPNDCIYVDIQRDEEDIENSRKIHVYGGKN